MERESNPSENVKSPTERLNRLSPEHQDVISGYSSFLLEPDVHARYEGSPRLVGRLAVELREQGLTREGVIVALQFFGLRGERTKKRRP